MERVHDVQFRSVFTKEQQIIVNKICNELGINPTETLLKDLIEKLNEHGCNIDPKSLLSDFASKLDEHYDTIKGYDDKLIVHLPKNPVDCFNFALKYAAKLCRQAIRESETLEQLEKRILSQRIKRNK